VITQPLHRPLTTPKPVPNTIPTSKQIMVKPYSLQILQILSSHRALFGSPFAFRLLPSPTHQNILIFVLVQIALITLRTFLSRHWSEMLAEVSVTFRTFILTSLANVLSAEIAHAVSADTGEFVAARGFDEGSAASRTDSFDGVCACCFDGLA